MTISVVATGAIAAVAGTAGVAGIATIASVAVVALGCGKRLRSFAADGCRGGKLARRIGRWNAQRQDHIRRRPGHAARDACR